MKDQALPLWSIADVEREIGLGKDTLRVWERRYGFPMPVRDAHGERRYDAAQLERLGLIKRLLDQGHRPGKVVAQSTAALLGLLAASAAARPPASPRSRAGAAEAPVPLKSAWAQDDRWMQWLQADQIGTLRQAIRQYLLRHGLAETIENLITPLGVQAGEAWLAGRLSVYQEHLYSEMVQALLREAMAGLAVAAGAPAQSPRVVLGTVPRERHALGLLMAECFLAIEGCDCRPVGPGTPLLEFVAAAVRMQADVVALSFSAHSPPQEVVNELRQLRAQLPATVDIWVGGSAPVLFSRRMPKGVVAMRRAQELVTQVAAWRRLHSVSPAG